MKKIRFAVFFCVLLLLPASLCIAQTQGVPTGVRVTQSPELPSIVNDRFRLDHPNVSATWKSVDEQNFEATFWSDSTHQPRQALYSSTGELIRKRSRLIKGSYPPAIDQYYLTSHPSALYAVWREDKPDPDTLYFGIRAMDTLWFGKAGNYLHDRNKLKASTLLAEKDRAYLLDISLANVERISMLWHVSDSNKVLSKELLAGHYSQIDQLVRRLGAAKNIPLPDPVLPVGRIREPSAKDFKRMDKRFLKILQKTTKKAGDKDLKELARHIITLESRFASQGEGGH